MRQSSDFGGRATSSALSQSSRAAGARRKSPNRYSRGAIGIGYRAGLARSEARSSDNEGRDDAATRSSNDSESLRARHALARRGVGDAAEADVTRRRVDRM